MEALLALVPVLVCPIVMGGMMWLMHRSNTDHTPANAAPHTALTSDAQPSEPQARSRLHLCLNWKIVGGLAVLGGALWFAAPGMFWTALPILALLACPLSMLVMMRGMGSGQCATQTSQQQPTGASDEQRVGQPLARIADRPVER